MKKKIKNEEEIKKALKKLRDPCPVCKNELAVNEIYTGRIGLVDEYDKVVGWICPYCNTEFNKDYKIIKYLGKGAQGGEA
jgi:uncharacterized CHY-type Zn-finger protein